MTSRKDARWVMNAIDLVAASCEQIQDAGACDKCPIKSRCEDMNDLLRVATCINLVEWMDFIDLADDVVDWHDELDYEAEVADQARKMESEERSIDERWGR